MASIYLLPLRLQSDARKEAVRYVGHISQLITHKFPLTKGIYWKNLISVLLKHGHWTFKGKAARMCISYKWENWELLCLSPSPPPSPKKNKGDKIAVKLGKYSNINPLFFFSLSSSPKCVYTDLWEMQPYAHFLFYLGASVCRNTA